MSDVAKHLPLSQRPGVDESTVSADWRPLMAECLTMITNLLETLAPDDWDRDSLCTGWQTRDVAGHLIWRLGSSRTGIIVSGVHTVLRERMSPLRLVDVEARRAGSAAPAQLVRSLRGIASARAAGTGRKGVGELAEIVVHGFDISRALNRQIAFPPRATGAVALAKILTAPPAIKAVVRHRTLRASDAGWEIGHGASIAAPAEALILFLYGRAGMPGASAVSPESTPPGA